MGREVSGSTRWAGVVATRDWSRLGSRWKRDRKAESREVSRTELCITYSIYSGSRGVCDLVVERGGGGMAPC